MIKPILLKALLSAALVAAGTLNASAVAFSYNSTNIPLSINDNSTTVSILVAGSTATINDLNVYLDVDHTFTGDLRISLFHVETATSVLLFDRRGGGGNNIGPATFDDEATTAIGAGSAPFLGAFRPEGLLSAFDGQSLNGTWKLSVSDVAWLDTGYLQAWGIRGDASVPGNNNTTVPDGGLTVFMLATALGGLALLRKKL